jgi:hypothetical protein
MQARPHTVSLYFFPHYSPTPRGIAASPIGGAQSGYQFYGPLYLRTAEGHVGNRSKSGVRGVVPAAGTNVGLVGTIAFAGDAHDPLLGRTADGAEVPNAMVDIAGTWLSIKGTTGRVRIYRCAD